MTWMNLHHLKYFLIIAEEGSLYPAIKKLLVGQLAVQLDQAEPPVLFNKLKEPTK